MNEHSELFKGVGKLKDFQLQIDPPITPKQQPIRRVPYHTKQKASEKLKRLQKRDIIEPVEGPTTWLNPIVATPKKDGSIRLCLDMRKANEAVIRERHVIPKMEDITTELYGATHFSKIDLREGYHQIELGEESRHITTFATHERIYRYKRLIYGVNSGFEAFQKQIKLVISGISGTKNISDDILVWGRNQQEHDNRLKQVLIKLQDKGLRVDPIKYFNVHSITFAGHLLSAEGLNLDPAKI